MAIKSGRLGQVLYDPAGTTPVVLVSINKWKLSQKTDYQNVTCFGDTNKVYVPGMKDASGTFSGFWNSTNVVLFEAVDAVTPGKLKLVPNSSEAGFFFQGLAYLDADIDTGAEGVPTVSGNFMAAGAFGLVVPEP